MNQFFGERGKNIVRGNRLLLFNWIESSKASFLRWIWDFGWMIIRFGRKFAGNTGIPNIQAAYELLQISLKTLQDFQDFQMIFQAFKIFFWKLKILGIFPNFLRIFQDFQTCSSNIKNQRKLEPIILHLKFTRPPSWTPLNFPALPTFENQFL